MATGSINTVRKVPFAYSDEKGLKAPFANGNAGKLYAGQEVFVSADFTIDKRVDGTSEPIGVLQDDVEAGEKGVVALAPSRILQIGQIKGGAVTAGQAVIPNGNAVVDDDGNLTALEYTVAASTDIYQAIAISGAAADGIFQALVLPVSKVLA